MYNGEVEFGSRALTRTPAAGLQEQLKYYTPAVHAAAFVLPAFAEAVVSTVRRPALPSVCRSVKTSLLDRSSLALVAASVLLGAAAATAVALVRRK